MTTIRGWWLAVLFAAVVAAWTTNRPVIGNNPSDPDRLPQLVNTCLITNDVNGLVGFYELVLQRKAKRTGTDYAEFPSGAGVLAIFSRKLRKNIFPAPPHRPGIEV